MIVDFQKFYDIKVNMVCMLLGEVYVKICVEVCNLKIDVWWVGMGDFYLQVVVENLIVEYKLFMFVELQDWVKKQVESVGYKMVGVYVGVFGWGYNIEIFKNKGFKEFKCWVDLFVLELKGEIQIVNLNFLGIVYIVFVFLVQIMGEDKVFDYLKKLNVNVL